MHSTCDRLIALKYITVLNNVFHSIFVTVASRKQFEIVS